MPCLVQHPRPMEKKREKKRAKWAALDGRQRIEGGRKTRDFNMQT